MKRVAEREEPVALFDALPQEILLAIFWFIFSGVGCFYTATRNTFTCRIVTKRWQKWIDEWIIGTVDVLTISINCLMNDISLPVFHGLKRLELGNDSSIKSWRQLPNLEFLSLKNRGEEDRIAPLSQLTSLTWLCLISFDIEEHDFKQFSHLKRLTLKTCSGRRTPHPFIGLSNLSTLELISIHFLDKHSFKPLRKLERLIVTDTNLKGSHLYPLFSSLRRLEFLGLSYNIDSNASLPSLPQLQSLVVEHEYVITDRVISEFYSLTELRMIGDESITLEGLVPFKNTLESLTLPSTFLLRHWKEVIQFPQLKQLYIEEKKIDQYILSKLKERQIEVIIC